MSAANRQVAPGRLSYEGGEVLAHLPLALLLRSVAVVEISKVVGHACPPRDVIYSFGNSGGGSDGGSGAPDVSDEDSGQRCALE